MGENISICLNISVRKLGKSTMTVNIYSELPCMIHGEILGQLHRIVVGHAPTYDPSCDPSKRGPFDPLTHRPVACPALLTRILGYALKKN